MALSYLRLYHLTPSENVRSILRVGLRDSRPQVRRAVAARVKEMRMRGQRRQAREEVMNFGRLIHLGNRRYAESYQHARAVPTGRTFSLLRVKIPRSWVSSGKARILEGTLARPIHVVVRSSRIPRRYLSIARR